MKTGIGSFALLAFAGPIVSCADADITAWQVWEPYQIADSRDRRLRVGSDQTCCDATEHQGV